jgi:hypothetical protein
MYYEEKRSVFILLTRTSTPFSKAIHFVTHSDYTHASLGIAENSYDFFSFGRKKPYTLPTTAGFINENLAEGILLRNPDAPCILYRLQVPKQVYDNIEDKIHAFETQYEQYSYSFLGTVLCFFNVPHAIKNKYFCSQFVAEILDSTNALQLDKSPSVYHPNDFRKETELEKYYEGTLGNLMVFLKQNHTYYEYLNGTSYTKSEA